MVLEKESTYLGARRTTPQDSRDNPFISVVVPCYNAQTTIRQCLDALRNQSLLEDEYEVIVVDSSDDSTPEIIEKEYSWVKLIHLSTKTPPGAARNLGIQVARGDIIACTDSDCIVSHDWLRRLRDAHVAWPEAAVVGGSMCNGNPEVFFGWVTFLIEFAYLLPTDSVREVQGFATANSSFKRWVFRKYGGFHQHDVTAEDVLFNWTLIKGGETVIFDPKAYVYHLNKGNLRRSFHHLHHLGKGVAWVRLHHDIPYSFLARSRFLGPLLAPVRTARTIWRTLLGAPRDSWRLLLLWPFILLGFIYFGLGEAKCVSDFSKQRKRLM